jgi:hypothetical protein
MQLYNIFGVDSSDECHIRLEITMPLTKYQAKAAASLPGLHIMPRLEAINSPWERTDSRHAIINVAKLEKIPDGSSETAFFTCWL